MGRDTGTTREEDLAYCLLGIFGVFIPVIYGEGKENARHRLNKAIEEKNSQVGLLSMIRPYVAGAINGLIGGIGGAIATLAMILSTPLDEEERTNNRSGQWVEISSYALCKQDIKEIMGEIFSLPTSSIRVVQVSAP